MSKIIPPVKPYFPDSDIEDIKSYVEKILRSGMLTLHTYTEEFEKEFAKICGIRHAIAVNSGTAALEIILRCMNLKHGDEVLVPTNTFSATAAAVIFAGGKPVLTDINPETLCVDVNAIKRKITDRTKGLIVVHIGGLICPDIIQLREICEDHGIFIIEDAAHAHGSKIDGKLAGSLGHAAAFSFYPTKVITTGEGGMITTDEEELAEKAKILRDQGKENYASNIIIELGYNWRITEISAVIGLVQLKRLNEIIEKRNIIAKIYDEFFSNISNIAPIKTPSNIINNYYKYVAILDKNLDRDVIKQKLRKKGVLCSGEVYWPPLHMQPLYRRLLEVRDDDFPNANDVCKRMICPPLYTGMSVEDAQYVTEKFKEVLMEI